MKKKSIIKKEEAVVSESMEIGYEDGILNASFCPAEWGRKKAAWDGRDVCLCLPTYGPINEATMFTWMAMVMRYRMAIRLEHRGSDSMIARSRNQLTKRFLATGATWSVWFDSDMVFPFGHPGAFATITGMRDASNEVLGQHAVERLISWGRTVVGGCYWDRRGSGRLIAGGSVPILQPIPSNNLAAVAFVGTGCLAVKREVFLAIAEKFPDTMQEDSLGNECGFFTPIQTDKRMLGEDEAFAWRATQAGHPTYLDLGLICGHVGETIHGMPEKGSRI